VKTVVLKCAAPARNKVVFTQGTRVALGALAIHVVRRLVIGIIDKGIRTLIGILFASVSARSMFTTIHTARQWLDGHVKFAMLASVRFRTSARGRLKIIGIIATRALIDAKKLGIASAIVFGSHHVFAKSSHVAIRFHGRRAAVSAGTKIKCRRTVADKLFGTFRSKMTLNALSSMAMNRSRRQKRM
jgi:hypothetical protein